MRIEETHDAMCEGGAYCMCSRRALFRFTEVDIPTERDETKPCRPIYCAKHYDGDESVECVRAYQCPGVGDEA